MTEKYDPMADFWKRFFPFLFALGRGVPVIVFMVIASTWLIKDRADIRADLKAEIVQAKKDCAEAISGLRTELKTCRINNDSLTSKNIELSLRLLALEIKYKRK